MSQWSLNRYLSRQALEDTGKPACIMISGWGVNSDIFELILSGLSEHFNIYLAELSDYKERGGLRGAAKTLSELVTETFQGKSVWLIGWSLGGNIALEMANQKPEIMSGLILLSVNPCFIARSDWTHAVSPSQFDRLSDQIGLDVNKGLRQFDRLQCFGDKKQKQLIKALAEFREITATPSSDELLAGLNWLKGNDQRVLLNDLRMPILCLFGENDVLVPVSVMADVDALNGKIESELVLHASHLLFLTQPEKFFVCIERFVQTVSHNQEKQQMADRFSKAAESYDDFSDLQKIVGHQLIDKMGDLQVPIMMDAGCGTGFFSENLMEKSQYLVGVDLAGGMLKYSQTHHVDVQSWVRGDIENLPFNVCSIGGIFSSLAVQWVDDFGALLMSWHEALSDEGEVFISTLGPRSLYELKASFERIDRYQHVNAFLSFEETKAAIALSPFELVAADRHEEVVKYTSPMGLMKDLKGIGASLVKRGGARGLMSKTRLAALTEVYENYRLDDGLFPATYEVIYLHLRKKANDG